MQVFGQYKRNVIVTQNAGKSNAGFLMAFQTSEVPKNAMIHS